MKLSLEINSVDDLLRVTGHTKAEVAKVLGLTPLYFGQQLAHGGLFLDQVEAMAAELATRNEDITADLVLDLLGRENVKIRGTLADHEGGGE